MKNTGKRDRTPPSSIPSSPSFYSFLEERRGRNGGTLMVVPSSLLPAIRYPPRPFLPSLHPYFPPSFPLHFIPLFERSFSFSESNLFLDLDTSRHFLFPNDNFLSLPFLFSYGILKFTRSFSFISSSYFLSFLHVCMSLNFLHYYFLYVM